MYHPRQFEEQWSYRIHATTASEFKLVVPESKVLFGRPDEVLFVEIARKCWKMNSKHRYLSFVQTRFGVQGLSWESLEQLTNSSYDCLRDWMFEVCQFSTSFLNKVSSIDAITSTSELGRCQSADAWWSWNALLVVNSVQLIPSLHLAFVTNAFGHGTVADWTSSQPSGNLTWIDMIRYSLPSLRVEDHMWRVFRYSQEPWKIWLLVPAGIFEIAVSSTGRDNLNLVRVRHRWNFWSLVKTIDDPLVWNSQNCESGLVSRLLLHKT